MYNVNDTKKTEKNKKLILIEKETFIKKTEKKTNLKKKQKKSAQHAWKSSIPAFYGRNKILKKTN